MTAGRPKIPSAMKEKAGTDRKDRTNEHAPKVPAMIPPRPAFLDSDPQAAQLYDVVAQFLAEMGVVGKPDSLALSLLADQMSNYLKFREKINKDGPVLTGSKGGSMSHPLITHMNTTYNNIHKMLVQYGLTAATRENVNANLPVTVSGDTDAGDTFEAFLSNKTF